MNSNLVPELICLLLLITLIGVGIADETPDVLIYLQGGNSSISKEVDGTSVITIQDVVPYVYVATGEKSKLLPITLLSKLTYPLNSAVIFSGNSGNSGTLEVISNVSLSDGNKLIRLNLTPLQFYDGELLSNYANDNSTITLKDETHSTGIYIETKEKIPINAECPGGCAWNGFYCGDYRGWICTPNGPCTTDCGSEAGD